MSLPPPPDGAGARTESVPLEEARRAMGAFADALTLDQLISARKAAKDLGWQPSRPSVLRDLKGAG